MVVQAVTFNLECIFNAKMCVNSADRHCCGGMSVRKCAGTYLTQKAIFLFAKSVCMFGF